MKKNIVFLDEYSVNGADLSAIKALGNYIGYSQTKPSETVERCKDAEIVITNKVVISAEIIAQLPKLELICVAATGVNNIDLDAAAKRGIPVKNAAGYSTYAVAETTIGGALSLYRNIVYYDQFVKEGSYATSPVLFIFNPERPVQQLYGRKWGIIGLGAIGRAVANLASAFGCEVAYHSVSGAKREEAYSEMPLNKLLEWADVVSIHAPLSDKTRNLIAKEQFEIMKPNAIIINVARGGIVNECDLAEALNNNVIAGAALDVFSQEPINADNPLFRVKDQYKLLLSPHNAWSADKAIDNLVKCIADNISGYLA